MRCVTYEDGDAERRRQIREGRRTEKTVRTSDPCLYQFAPGGSGARIVQEHAFYGAGEQYVFRNDVQNHWLLTGLVTLLFRLSKV